MPNVPRSSLKSMLEKPSLLRAAALILFGGWLISSALVHVLSRAQGGNSQEYANAGWIRLNSSSDTTSARLIDSFTITKEEALQLAGTFQVSTQPFLSAIANAAMNTFSVFNLWSSPFRNSSLRKLQNING